MVERSERGTRFAILEFRDLDFTQPSQEFILVEHIDEVLEVVFRTDNVSAA